MLKLLTVSFFLSLLMLLPVFAQQKVVEYGDVNDLRGITRIFIDTGTEVRVRNNIIKNIRKKFPKLNFVTKAEDAEVLLIFNKGVVSYQGNLQTTTTTDRTVYEDGSSRTYETTTTNPNINSYFEGRGLIIRRINNVRELIIQDFVDEQRSSWERDPSTNFAREFVKLYQNANK